MNVPQHWTFRRLGDICDVRIGRTPSRAEPSYWGAGERWLSIADMNQGRDIRTTKETITPLAIKDCGCNRVDAGTVLLSFKLSIGKVSFAGCPLYTNEAIAALPIKNPKEVDPTFLYWTLQTIDMLGEVDHAAKGLTLNKAKLVELQIPLPPLAEQKRIAAVLDKADDLRGKRRQALAALDTLLQSVFLDMFGDPVTNPKGWPKSELQQITTAIIDCPHTTPRWTESGVLALRTSNLGYGEWQWDDTRYVDEAQYVERSKRGELETGDIVLSREGTVGIAAIVPPRTKMCMGQRLVQVKPNRDKAVEQYLLHVLLYELAPERIAGVMAGSTSKHLNVVELRELRIPVPTVSVQKQFAKFLDSIKRQRRNAVDAASELDTLFAALQSAAFAGTLFNGEMVQAAASKSARPAARPSNPTAV